MHSDGLAYYRQLLAERGGLREAACITYVRGVDEAALIRAFGGDPASATTGPARELAGLGYDSPVLLVAAGDDGGLIGVEYNGFQGSRPEVLRAASAGGVAVSVYWNINGTNEFRYAAAGRTVTAFDMSRPDDRHGSDPDALGELPPGEWSDRYPAGLALAEHRTGLRLTTAMLDGDLRRALLRPVPEDLVPESLTGHPALADEFVRSVLAAPTRDKIPAILGYLAELSARDTGIDGEPAVAAALSALRSGTPDATARDRVAELVERYQRAFRERGAPLERVHAATALAAALDPDPARASGTVLGAASYTMRTGDHRVRYVVLGRCVSRALAAG